MPWRDFSLRSQNYLLSFKNCWLHDDRGKVEYFTVPQCFCQIQRNAQIDCYLHYLIMKATPLIVF